MPRASARKVLALVVSVRVTVYGAVKIVALYFLDSHLVTLYCNNDRNYTDNKLLEYLMYRALTRILIWHCY